MTNMHLLVDFVGFLRGLNYVREVSPEFEMERAASGHALIKRVSDDLAAQEEINRADNPLFPRVAVADLVDVGRLVESMAETTTELKRNFVTMVGKYMMGNDELLLSDIERMGDEYLASCRLTTALTVHYEDKHKEAQKRKEADEKAAGAYATMDEKAGGDDPFADPPESENPSAN